MNIETIFWTNRSASGGGGRKCSIMSNDDRKEKSDKGREPKEGAVESHARAF